MKNPGKPTTKEVALGGPRGCYQLSPRYVSVDGEECLSHRGDTLYLSELMEVLDKGGECERVCAVCFGPVVKCAIVSCVSCAPCARVHILRAFFLVRERISMCASCHTLKQTTAERLRLLTLKHDTLTSAPCGLFAAGVRWSAADAIALAASPVSQVV